MKLHSNFSYLIVAILVILSCKDDSNQEKENRETASSNWELIGPGGGGSTFIPTFAYSNEDEFFIRCDMTGAYHTNDGGNSFDQINNPGGSHAFAFDPLDSLTMYIGSVTLNKSIDGGSTWDVIFPAKEEILDSIYLGDHADFNLVTSKNSLYHQTAYNGLDAQDQYKNLVVRNIKVDPNDSNVIYFSSGKNLFVSQDQGASWSRIELDSNINFIYTNTTSAKEKLFVFTNLNINVVEKNTWKTTSTVFPKDMSPVFKATGGTLKEDGKTVFYALHHNIQPKSRADIVPTSLWVSEDLGKTWVENQHEVVANNSGPTPMFSDIKAAENDATHVYMVTSSYKEQNPNGEVSHWFGAVKSSDLGKSWQWVWKGGGGSGKYGMMDGSDAPNLKDAWVHKAFGKDYIKLFDVGVAPNDGNTAIVTDWYRSMRTIDGGKTWLPVYSTEQTDGSYVSNGLDVTTTYGVHHDPFDADHIAISYTDIGYHHSYNGGKSWFRSVEGIPRRWQNTCYWMVFDPGVKDKVWSVWSNLHDFPRGKMTRNPEWTNYGAGGVALSVDGGKTWKPTVEGMGLDTPSASIVLDKNSPVGNRTLYVAAYGKGVFKSVDDGKTWKLHNNGILGSLAAFELTLQEDGTLYLVTSPTPQHRNGKTGIEVHMGAVYKSVDGAESWQRLDLGQKVQFPNGMTYDPSNPDKLYVGCWSDIHLSDMVGRAVTNVSGGNKRIDLEGGILMSENGGESWTQIFDPDKYVYDVTVDERFPGRLYCNTFNHGAFRSDDYGKTWNKIRDYDFYWGHRVMVDKNDKEKVYLTTFGSSVWHGIPEIDQKE